MRLEKPAARNAGTWIETDDRRRWRIASTKRYGAHYGNPINLPTLGFGPLCLIASPEDRNSSGHEFRKGIDGRHTGGSQRRDRAMEQWPDRRPDQSPESAQARNVRTGERRVALCPDASPSRR